MDNRFWVFQWLEDHHITTLSEAANLLPKYKVIDNLRLRAEQGLSTQSPVSSNGVPILAGTGVDFYGGNMVCPSPQCMRGQVDKLFTRVWHYFDRIVVRDAFTPLLLNESKCTHLFQEELLRYLPPLLYLREIGAEQLVEFRPKPIRERHWIDQAKREGLAGTLSQKELLVEELRKGARFYEKKGLYCVANEDLMASATGIPVKNHPGRSKRELQQILMDLVFAEYLKELTRDVAAAHQLQLPLGATIGIHGKMLAATYPVTVADVAFQLDLPVLDGIPVKTLIRVRQEENESFVQFRAGLRSVITERLKEPNGSSARAIAEQVRSDVVEPALAKIRRRLEESERAFARKAGVSMALGAFTTTCGLLAGLPPMVSLQSVAAAVWATGHAAFKHIEEKQEISLCDMYFIWKTTQHYD